VLEVPKIRRGAVLCTVRRMPLLRNCPLSAPGVCAVAVTGAASAARQQKPAAEEVGSHA
jgi:hypothetical protein